ncbi:UNKNOWN [Stylonychia lemnae]|uniref:SGS domain-containing protein n=1 Tax=Stylonychia lemnae TaxID=5949 RepID=A0A078B2P3_STYLE|nr:UNKNOWN [Stylonychia lemnae]|eukprot:CDW87492.1 UNKNOWN [Stylonychia lemnae]
MEYSRDIENIQKDLEDLNTLLLIANRDFSKKLLEKEIKHLLCLESVIDAEQNLLKQISTEVVEKQDKGEQEETKDYIKKDYLIYSMLTRMYVTQDLKGIGEHEKKNIDCEFTDNSIDLRILSFNGKNFRLNIQPLNSFIDPASCKMKKNKAKLWDDVKEKKSLVGDSSVKKKNKGDGGESKDPGNSLMNMMKELYQSGDDQMKRTIAESWEKAQKEKGAKLEL